MARKRRKALLEHHKKPTKAGYSGKRRDVQADTRFSLMVHSLGRDGVRPLIVRPVVDTDATPVIRKTLFLDLYRLSTAPLKAGARSPLLSWFGKRGKVGVQGERHLAATGRMQAAIPGLIREAGWAVPATMELNGETVFPIVVPPWSDTLDGMKAVALCVAGKELGHRPVNLHLSAALQSRAINHPKGPARFLQGEISRKLKRAGFQGAEFAFVIDTNAKGALHLHGCMGLSGVDWDGLAGRRHVRSVLKKIVDAQPSDGKAVLIKRWTDFPEGFGGYAAKYAAVVKSELQPGVADLGEAPSVLLKTRGITRVAAEWWDAQRETNLALLIDAVRREQSAPRHLRLPSTA